jgi:hypothetical protein
MKTAESYRERVTREEAEQQAEHAANLADAAAHRRSVRIADLEKQIAELTPWHNMLLEFKDRATTLSAKLLPVAGSKSLSGPEEHRVRTERQNLENTLAAIEHGPVSYEVRNTGDGYFGIWAREAGVIPRDYKRGLIKTEARLAELNAELSSL